MGIASIHAYGVLDAGGVGVEQVRMLTPSQIEFARRRQERLHRIAAAAFEPLGQLPEPVLEPEPAPAIIAVDDQPWPVPAWLEDAGPLSVKKIKQVVAANFGVSLIDLDSPRRDKKAAFPRQIVCYLAKTLTTNSLPAIGRKLGGRDHTTILYGVRKIERMMKTDEALARRVASLSQRITGGLE